MNNRVRLLARCCFPLTTLGLLFYAGSSTTHAQTPAHTQSEAAHTPALSVNARTVIVDVVVTGKNGTPLTGLHRENFAVEEDGVSQQITTFEEHSGQGAQPPLAPLPPNIFTNVPRTSPAGSPIVLLLDSLNTPLSNQIMVRKQMLNYLKTMQPGIPMAIFTLGSRLRSIQGFTSDPAILRSVLQSLNSHAGPQASTILGSKADLTAQTAATQINATLQQFLSEQTASQDGARALITLDTLQQLAHALSGIPGRKSVIWFSGAFPSYIFPKQSLSNPSAVQRDFADETRAADAALAAAHVAIYPVAAEGLAADSLYAVDTQLTGQSAYDIQQQSIANLNTGAQRRNSDHATMDLIAEQTGGTAFYNNNGLDKAIARVAESASGYYTLSYTPTKSSASEHFRKISIKLTGAHGNLTYRRGYYMKEDHQGKLVPAGANPLRSYMRPDTPDSTEIPLALLTEAAPSATSAGESCSGEGHSPAKPLICYSVQFVVNARRLHFDTTPDGTHRDSLEIALVIYSKRGRAINWITKHVDLNVDADGYSQLLSSGVHLSLLIGLPTGATDLSGGVYDSASGLAGTLTVPLSNIVRANQLESQQ